jgi:hypothetical protein
LQCLDRTHFFAGQLLSEADLNNEQSYWLAKNRLHNRYLVGWGVACGMQVVCSECEGWVTVRSGYAIDPCGNDIIVCEDQNFNVAKAIRDCCAPAKAATPDCSPLRYNPAQNCTGTTQTWCITIQYEEQPSRLVTPLTQATSQSSQACGCGCSNGNSNGNGKKNSPSSTSSSCKTSSASTQTAAATPAAACQPTRIAEGFTLGVISADDYKAQYLTATPGSLTAALDECKAGLLQLEQRAPVITENTLPQAAYQSTCTFLAAVKNYFATSSTVTHCNILDALGQISVPTSAQTGVYIGIVAEITRILAYAFLDCICFSLLPPCPVNPCDNRIILACVTVQDGSIVDICHFTGRKQLITLHTLGYWLGGLGLDRIVAEIDSILALYCCAGESRLGNFSFGASAGLYNNDMLTTAGFANGADVQRFAAHYVAQSLGASVVNAISPQARAVDLRPMVNMQAETVMATLKQQGFQSVTTQSVDGDPFWNADAASTGASFAPAAVSVDQPIKIYTQGKTTVGFQVIDPTTAKIQDLQDQITALQNQLGQSRVPQAASTKAVNPNVQPAQPAPQSPKSKKKP